MEEILEINRYFWEINRSSLVYSNDATTNFVIYNFVVIHKLIKYHYFLHSVNQRKLAIHISLNVFANYELLFNVDTCDDGYSTEKYKEYFFWSSTNALLNNFCSKENNDIKNNKLSKNEKYKHSSKFCICTLFFISIIWFLNLSFVSNLFAYLYLIFFLFLLNCFIYSSFRCHLFVFLSNYCLFPNS